MHPPPGSEWRVSVPAVGVRCGCVSVGQGPRLLFTLCIVTVALFLLDRWYRALVVSYELALGLFLVLGSPVIRWRLPGTGLHVSGMCCCPAECGVV